MSGLAAGIRVALAGKKVLIVERHKAFGGLNSFYARRGRVFDVGLHAMTNYVPEGCKGTPLGKIFRQLRIDRETWQLGEQHRSKICLPDVTLTFTNHFEVLDAEIREKFPDQRAGWERLLQYLERYDAFSLSAPVMSARKVLGEYLTDPLLLDALLLPLMYYGSARENDIDWSQFAILFQSIYREGFARPYAGVKCIVQSLVRQYKACGGKWQLGCGVRRLVARHERIEALELDDGSLLQAPVILSSVGAYETLNLCDANIAYEGQRLSFVEAIYVLNEQPSQLGFEDTVIFFSQKKQVSYQIPDALWDTSSGVICCPNNYHFPEEACLQEGWLRVTALANYELWKNLSRGDYKAQKQKCLTDLGRVLVKYANIKALDLSIEQDCFTPLTIERFTGHVRGAVYGSSEKSRDGKTPYSNLFLMGTDQGFLGITGALLSGISMANMYAIR